MDGCLTSTGATVDSGANVATGCRANAAVNAAGGVTFVSDDLLYIASPFANAVAAVKRDFAPRCTDQSVAVGFESALAVPLACSDRNGDALTISIAAQPNAGQLGAIDAAGARVFYNPFGGFTGVDSFTYRADGGGQSSNTAVVSLNVAPAPPASRGGLDGDRDGFFAGQDCNDANSAIRPGALEVRGNRVDENCDGIAEPFPTVTSGVSAKWDINGSRFKLTQLTISNPPKGAKLEFRCAGKGCPLKSKKLSGKVHRGLLMCGGRWGPSCGTAPARRSRSGSRPPASTPRSPRSGSAWARPRPSSRSASPRARRSRRRRAHSVSALTSSPSNTRPAGTCHWGTPPIRP